MLVHGEAQQILDLIHDPVDPGRRVRVAVALGLIRSARRRLDKHPTWYGLPEQLRLAMEEITTALQYTAEALLPPEMRDEAAGVIEVLDNGDRT